MRFHRFVLRAFTICACVAVSAYGLVATPAAPAHATLADMVRAVAPLSGPVTLTNPGGNLTASMSDGSINSTADGSQAISDFEQSLGLSAGASLSSVVQALYKKMSGATPTVPAPPTFSGGTLSVSGNTITATIPAADIPVSSTNLSGALAGFLGALLGGLTAALVYFACNATFFFTIGLAAVWISPLCTAMAFFFWSFIGIIFFDWATGVPLNDTNTWATIASYSFTSAGLGVGWPFLSRFILWFFPTYFGPAGTGVAGVIADLAAWFGGAAPAAAAAAEVGAEIAAAQEAAVPAALGPIVVADGMAGPEQTGTVTSGFAGDCMDAYGTNGSASPGQIVAINACNGNPAQSWTAWSDNAVSVFGLCLDTGGGTASDGGTLTDLATGECLDDQGSNTSPGTRLQIYHCNTTTAQEWTLPGSTGGGGGGGGTPPTGSACDIYAFYGTACVAAYSTTRALYAGYGGPLYQVQRASDGATTNIGLLGTGGNVNASEQDSFCGQYTCTITKIYDQSPNGNNLTIGPAGGAAGADRGAVASLLPITLGGNEAYGVDITPGVGYRDNGAHGTAVNGQPEGMYMVASGSHVNSGCCFDFGNAETNSNDNGNGHMDAVNLSTTCFFSPCNGSGPWVGADMENGLFLGGNGSNTGNAGNSSSFVTAVLKNNGQNTYELEGGNSQSGGLSKWYDGALPNTGGYAPMHQEGAITLGVGGDNSNSSVGSFFEGVMTSGFPTDQADAAVQANIVAAGYGGSPNGYGTGGSLLGVPVAMTANGAGQCLDILGDDTGSNGTVADIWSCQPGAVDQHWTHNANGSLETMGRCLDIDGDGTAPGTKVELWDCNGAGGQVWQQQSNGSLLNPQSGLCLDDPSGSTTNGTVLQIWNCLGNQAQQFLINGSTGPGGGGGSGGGGPGGGGSGQSTAPPAGTVSMNANGANQCVDDAAGGSGVAGTVVDITTCDGAPEQSWTHNSNGTLTTLGLCLDIDGNGTAPGTKVELWTCNGLGGQVWQQYPNGSLYNPQSGLCLDDPSGSTANGTGLQIWNCLGNQAQEFSVNGGNPIPMLANGAGQCVDVLGNDNGGDGTVVEVWSCQSNAVDQHWVLNSNGSLETLGRCLDIDGNGTAPGTKVELWDCNGLGGQVWQPRSNGELYNPQSGLCLDDPSGSTTNGTVLQIWNCLGNQAQNYAFGY